jgi:hypothetical protein
MAKIFKDWLPGDIQTDIHVQAYDYTEEIHIRFIRKDSDGKLYFAKPLKLEFSEKPHKEGAQPTSTLILTQNESVKIFGELRKVFEFQGLRTKDESRLEGILEATNKHLDDMRKLVFKDNE